MALTATAPTPAPSAPKITPTTSDSITSMARMKRRWAPMARSVPISRTRSSVAITKALLMMTRAMTKMIRIAT